MSDKQHSNFHKVIGIALGLIVCGASLWLLKKQLGGKSLQDILVEFKHIPARQFWAASGFATSPDDQRNHGGQERPDLC